MPIKKVMQKVIKHSPKKYSRQDTLARRLISSSKQLAEALESFAKKLAKKLAKRGNTIATPFANALLDKMERIVKDDLLLSITLLFLPIIYMLAAFSLLANIGLGRWVLPSALLLWATAVALLHRDKSWQKIAVQLLLFLIAFALIALVTSQFLDTNYDSREYHHKAIQALLDGANPFYEPLKWGTYSYPIAHWLISLSLIFWTNSIEASFALTAPAILTAFICSWRFIETLPAINRTWHMILATMLAANPIAIWTLFNHYNDGVFVSTLLSSFMLMLAFVAQGKNQKKKPHVARTRRYYIYITVSLILLINIKFTGLLFGAILGITALAYAIAINKNNKKARKTILQLLALGTVAPIIALVIFGFFPYATSTIHNKNPFYSTNIYDEQGNKMGTIVKPLFEKKFYDRSNYEKWWIALFSKPQKNFFWKPSPLPPFSSISPLAFARTFGSFFSGAMILCLTLILFIRNKAAWIIISGIIISIFITEVGFFFRLAPQNWWIPILILIFFFAQDKKDKNKNNPIHQSEKTPKAPKIMAIIIVLCLVQSPAFIFLNYATVSVLMKSKIAEMRKQGGWYVTIDENLPQKNRFFRYYASGLTGVRLPALEKCPENAQKQKIHYGLMLCRP